MKYKISEQEVIEMADADIKETHLYPCRRLRIFLRNDGEKLTWIVVYRILYPPDMLTDPDKVVLMINSETGEITYRMTL